MKLVLALLGLMAFTNYAVADECDEEQAEKCITGMIQVITNGQSEINCRVLRDASACLVDLSNRCLDSEEREQAQKHIDEMVISVNNACPPEENNGIEDEGDDDDDGLSPEEREMLTCLDDEQKLMNYVGQCAEQALTDMSSGSFRYGSSLSELHCRAFLTIAECVSDKVSSACGEPVREPFFHGMMLALKTEDPRAAASSECADLVKEAEEFNDNAGNKRKRRSIEKVQFSKLMP